LLWFRSTSAEQEACVASAKELTPMDAHLQRVMVMSDGFAWNGRTYDSLSKVAFAITGTNWNGPRFFGLRNKEDRLAMGEARS
jgi:Protein of unknown function (DUF2924)